MHRLPKWVLGMISLAILGDAPQLAAGAVIWSADEAAEFPNAARACKLKLGVITESDVGSPAGTRCHATCRVISVLKGDLGTEVRVTFTRDGNGPIGPSASKLEPGEVYIALLQGEREPFTIDSAMRATAAVVEPKFGAKPGDRLMDELVAMCASDDADLHREAIEQIGIIRDARGTSQVSAAADSRDEQLARAGLIAQYQMRIAPDAKKVMELFDARMLATWYEESGTPRKDAAGRTLWREQGGLRLVDRGLPDFDYATYVREGIKREWIRKDDHTLYLFFGIPWKVQRKECVPELVKLLDDPDKKVRWWAVLCLTHTVENQDRPQWSEYESSETEELTKWRSWWKTKGQAFVAEPKP